MEEIQEIELLKAEDGLGFNIRGGKDAEYVREDNGIFVTKIRERGSAARVSLHMPSVVNLISLLVACCRRSSLPS